MITEFRLKPTIATCALALSFLATGCGTTSVQVTRLVPGEVHLPGVKAIAVLPFQSRRPQEGNLAADKIAMELLNAGYYTVVERTQLEAVLNQHRIEGTGLFNESTGTEIGQLVKADAVVMGNIPLSEVKDAREFVKTKEGGYYLYSRGAQVAADCKVVRMLTGVQAASFRVQWQTDDSQQEPGELASPESLIDSCISAMAKAVLLKISPHKATLRVYFDPGGKELKSLFTPGIQFAKAGVPDQALDCFRAAVSRHPEASSAHYNLGVALFLNNQFVEAEKSVNHAITLYPTSRLAKTTSVSLDTYSRMISTIRAESQIRDALQTAREGAAR